MLVSPSIGHARLLKAAELRSPGLTSLPHFQGLGSDQVRIWEVYEKATRQSPYELISAMEQLLAPSYLSMIEMSHLKDRIDYLMVDGKPDLVKLKNLGYFRGHDKPEESPVYKAHETALIEKLKSKTYLGKSGNTAIELKAYIDSLPFYTPSPECLATLGQKLLLEADKDGAMMP